MLDRITELKMLIDKHEIISFDIFDTALLRPYARPFDLFLHLERLNEKPGFFMKRIQAEKDAREKYPQQDDVTYDQIYELIDEQYKCFKQKELDLEKQVIVKNPEIYYVYRYALEKNKRIIFTSDMYLPQSFIEQLLIKNDYKEFEKLYVSSNLMKTKWSSKLYMYILPNINEVPENILHIGDNYYSDVEVPESLGITSYYHEKAITRLLNSDKRAELLYRNNEYILGISIILGLFAIKSPSYGNYWTKIGYNYAGPVIYTYMKWLEKNIKQKGIKDIFFVARDGYTLKKVFDIFGNIDIKTHYIYTPRIFYYLLSLNSYLHKIQESSRLQVIQTALDYYKDKHSFLSKNTPIIKDVKEGEDFIESNGPIYKELTKKEKDKYTKYIESFNIRSNNVALVDTISLSFSAQRFLSSILDTKDFEGYYWILSAEIYEIYKDYKFNSFQRERVADFENYQNIIQNWNFMEFLITAPEAPIINIEDGKPVYKEASIEEQIRIEKYPFVSDGAIEFAKDILNIFGHIDTFIDYPEIIYWLNILNNNPTEEDKEEFKQIKHACFIDHNEYFTLFENWYKDENSQIV